MVAHKEFLKDRAVQQTGSAAECFDFGATELLVALSARRKLFEEVFKQMKRQAHPRALAAVER